MDARYADHVGNVRSQHRTRDRAAPGKIFIGGLARETTSAQLVQYFGKYGKITDFVIMKDWETGHPRGFGFVTFADPSVVDIVIQETHIINGKQVGIKRTIPEEDAGSRDNICRKILVGGIPATVGEDQAVENLLKKGNRLELKGAQVEIRKAEANESNPPPPSSNTYNDSRASSGGGGLSRGYDLGGSYGRPVEYEGYGAGLFYGSGAGNTD